MIKFIMMANEHKQIPEYCIDKSEFRKNNETPDYLRYSYNNGQMVDNGKYSIYCTYAWIETDEIEIKNRDKDNNKLPIAVMDYKPHYSKRTQFVFEEPIWNWISEERTNEEQYWISKNIDKINTIFLDFAHNNGFLYDVK